MGIYQAHDQNNKIVNTYGGVIGILDNPTALLKWATCGPVISEILKEEKDGILPKLHHEDTASFEKGFSQRQRFIDCLNTRIREPF